ncbi:unnamed protein product [Larinioides sclopetarius]|uniref:Dynein axonemal assembly factor 1 homolog n=1 Tax=Larinioides sclopetarius TaxID=280406 RepID=A0AAV1YY48_9ARAC
MGNRVGTRQKPVIMTKAFLEEKIVNELALVEGLNISELQRLVKIDGVERNLVLSLQLEQKSLLNIGNLWKFTLLTKLEIANNYIEEIEGLETLSSLQYLDLSFNYIKVIKGLDGLINLGYLNLSYNEILHLENLDNLKNLETFLVRYNKIKSFESIYYLVQFENLLCLGIEENPLMLIENARFHVLAVLPQLKFLDFVLVTENQLKEALLLYPVEKRSASKNKLFLNYDGQHFSSLWETHPPDKEAFVDGLAKGRGFELLLESDKNFRFLHSFPPAATIAEKYRKELSELFDEWHNKGRNYYKQMQEEKANFIKMVKEAENFAANVSGEEEYSYITFTEESDSE